jgi:hypothetical protein
MNQDMGDMKFTTAGNMMKEDIVERLNEAYITIAARGTDGLDAEAAYAMLDAVTEIERLREKCNKQAMVLQHLNPTKSPGVYFICGESGEKDTNGMPDFVHIAPAYGVDFSYVYKKTENVFAPEW